MGFKTLFTQSLVAAGLAAAQSSALSSSTRKTSTSATRTFTQVPEATSGGDDPINVFDNYCNRINHQSTYKGNSVYINSGVQTFANYSYNDPFSYNYTGNVTTGYNLYTIEAPIGNVTWDWTKNFTQQVAWLNGPEPQTNQPAPQITDGSMFAGKTGDSKIWLFGGTTSYWNTSFPGFTGPAQASLNLWSWDTLSHTWNSYATSNIGSRPYLGYRAEARSLSLGFLLGGILNSGSSTETQSFGDGKSVFLDGMVVLNFTNPNKPTARNISTSALGWPRAGGQGVYVPNFGQSGLAVFFGGGNKSVFDLSGNEQGSGAIPMSEITVFDVNFLYGNGSDSNSTGAWYRQTASGDIPDPRYRFCAVGSTTPDNGTFTIYMFGGRKDGTFYDQLYALSLPSFTWIKLWQGSSPRAGHTCHLVNDREIMTFGGAGQYDITQCDWEKRGVGIYDIPTQNWTQVNNPNAGAYSLPQKVVDVIGGNAQGSATKLDPDEGWSSPALARLFRRSATNGGSNNNGGSSSSGLSGGAIAGIVIGVLAALALLGLLAFFLMRKRRNRNGNAYTAAETNDGHSELPAGSTLAGAGAISEKPGYGEISEKDAGYGAKDAPTQYAYEAPGDASVAEAPGSDPRFEVAGSPAPAYGDKPATTTTGHQSAFNEPQELWSESRHR